VHSYCHMLLYLTSYLLWVIVIINVLRIGVCGLGFLIYHLIRSTVMTTTTAIYLSKKFITSHLAPSGSVNDFNNGSPMAAFFISMVIL
jgi:hypothetical protein